MRRRFLVAALAALAAGCACRRPAYGPPPVSRNETPEGLYAYFRECIHSEEYGLAWWCLSHQGRGHMPQQEFEAGFQSFRALRELITGSRVTAVNVGLSGESASLEMENAEWGVKQVFQLVVETTGTKRYWQVDLTKSDLSRMARQAEDYMAGKRPGHEM